MPAPPIYKGEKMTAEGMHEYIVNRYDGICETPELRKYYSGADYLNFGYWELDTSNQREACDNLMDQLLGMIPDKTGNILDVACGKGATTAYLLNHYRPEDVFGINISLKQLGFAQQNAPGSSFSIMNAAKLGFADGAFQNIISVEAAFHFDTREAFLKEAHRALKPGGSLVLSDVLMSMKGEDRRQSRTTANYIENLSDYEKLCKAAGFGDVEVRDVSEECWRRHYWYAVRYFHDRYLDGGISREQLEAYLDSTYERVPDMNYYLLAVAHKS